MKERLLHFTDGDTQTQLKNTFLSQTSWGRLRMNPICKNKSKSRKARKQTKVID